MKKNGTKEKETEANNGQMAVRARTEIVPSFSFAPRDLKEAMEFAEIISKSDLVPPDYKGKPGNVLIAVQMGAEIGLKALQAIQSIAVINGRPCIWGDAALGLVKSSGLLEDFEERDPGDAMKSGGGHCRAKRVGTASVIERTFSVEDAKKANLLGKAGTWQTYPGRMLQMRARGWCLRDGFPDVLKGLHIREEVEDYQQESKDNPFLPKKTELGVVNPEPVKENGTPSAALARETVGPDEPMGGPVTLPLEPAQNIVQIRIKDVRKSATKTTAGKAGLLFTVWGHDDIKYLTEDVKLATDAVKAKQEGIFCEIGWDKTDNPAIRKITSLTVIGDAQ